MTQSSSPTYLFD